MILRRIATLLWPDYSIYEANGNQPFSLNGWDHIPQNQYDYVPKGTHISGLASDFLLVPKNRYRLVLLPEQEMSADRGIGWITEDNSPEAYDRLWGSAEALEVFRAESGHARDKMTIEIVNHLEACLSAAPSVIDIGCGAGDLLAEVKKRCPEAMLAGLDYSGRAVEGVKLAFPEGEFRQFVIERELPYESGRFDLVMCCDVLEHLEKPHEVAAELVRICRPGGLVAIVVPDGEVDQFFGHYWFWNEQSLAAMLAPWNAEVTRLPESREFIARICVPVRREVV
jgi:2-polyprenyl-3-methyl-5-hydroxy-6-metoxy-1,4-benzoquinol methylase